ncbi:MAG: hypothetical protein ACI39E_05720 [Acutalibacteraceae bacterium]
MAENGFFRVGLRGFKKEDVLQYIDEMQRAGMQRMTESEQLRQQAEQNAAMQAERCAQATAQLQSLETEKSALADELSDVQKKMSAAQEQTARVTALAKNYKGEILQLRERISQLEQEVSVKQVSDADKAERETESLRAALSDAQKQSAQLERDLKIARAQDMRHECETLRSRVEELERENARYTALVGNVGQLMMELRGLAKTLLETSSKQSRNCILRAEAATEALENAAASLRAALQQENAELDAQQHSCEERLEEFMSNLEQTAQIGEDGFFR